jgi:hypothetical protein
MAKSVISAAKRKHQRNRNGEIAAWRGGEIKHQLARSENKRLEISWRHRRSIGAGEMAAKESSGEAVASASS